MHALPRSARLRFPCTGLVLLLAVAATPARAALIDFGFSFENVANGGGEVRGVIRGLVDGETRAATSVEVLFNASGFGVGEYVGSPFDNSFTVAGGVITGASFRSLGTDNSPPAVRTASLDLLFISDQQFSRAGLSPSPFSEINDSRAGLRFAPTSAAVPEPGILALGVAGFMALRWGHRRKTAALSA